MDRTVLKQRAKENLRRQYFPWLLVAFSTIIFTFLSVRAQVTFTPEFNIKSDWSSWVQFIEIIPLFVAVPLSRLALDLTKRIYHDALGSLFQTRNGYAT